MRINKIVMVQGIVFLEPQRNKKIISLFAQNNGRWDGPALSVYGEKNDMLAVVMTNDNKLSRDQDFSYIRLFEVDKKGINIIFRRNEGSGAKSKSKKRKQVITT